MPPSIRIPLFPASPIPFLEDASPHAPFTSHLDVPRLTDVVKVLLEKRNHEQKNYREPKAYLVGLHVWANLLVVLDNGTSSFLFRVDGNVTFCECPLYLGDWLEPEEVRVIVKPSHALDRYVKEGPSRR